MFNIPFNYRDGYNTGDPIPQFGVTRAIVWLDSLKGVYNGNPIVPAVLGNTDITLWKDQTEYKTDITGTTSSPTDTPTYSATSLSPSGTNSPYPYIRFNKSNADALSIKSSEATGLGSISSGLTVFFVIKRNTSSTWSSGAPIIQYSTSWTSLSDGFGIDADATPTAIKFKYYTESSTTGEVTFPWVNLNNVNFYYYSFRLSAGTITSYVGNQLINTTVTTGSNKNMKPVSSLGKFAIASSFNSGIYSQTTPLDVTEVLIYNGAIPNAGMTTVWNYFKTKYGFI